MRLNEKKHDCAGLLGFLRYYDKMTCNRVIKKNYWKSIGAVQHVYSEGGMAAAAGRYNEHPEQA